MVENPNNQNLFPKYEEELQSPIPHDETMNRAVNTSYQNKTGKTIFVFVQINMNPQVDVEFEHDTCIDKIPIDIMNENGLTSVTSYPLKQAVGSIATSFMIVPPNYYYALVDIINAQLNENLVSWLEVY